MPKIKKPRYVIHTGHKSEYGVFDTEQRREVRGKLGHNQATTLCRTLNGKSKAVAAGNSVAGVIDQRIKSARPRQKVSVRVHLGQRQTRRARELALREERRERADRRKQVLAQANAKA